MEIKSGCTRIVFIFSTFVVKVPKIRLLVLLKRFIKHTKNGDVQEKIKEHHVNMKFILTEFLLAGLRSNWQEYKYYKKHSEEEGLMPVRQMFLGFLEIQERGQYIPKKDPKWLKLKAILKKGGIYEHDLLMRENYSFWKGNLYLHDYGNELTINDVPRVLKFLQISYRT